MQDIFDAIPQIVDPRYMWVVKVFVVVFVTMVVAFIVARFLKTLKQRSRSTDNLWDNAICDALYKPARAMIWLLGVSYAAQIASKTADPSLLDVIPDARRVFTIAIFAWFVVALISGLEKNLTSDRFKHKPVDPTTAAAFGKLLRISVVITASLVGLQSLGYSVSGVLAFGGIGGIAVGFAAKDLLANFFGGLMVYLDRPFAVGDWVRSPDQNIEGTVEEIGWRLTRIRTFDKRPLYVPNATFTQISVENPSRMTNRRIKETIGVRYDDADKLKAIIEDVKKMIQGHSELDQQQTVIVNFNEFAASSLDFFIYCFTKTTNWVKYHEVKQDVMLQVIAIVREHGAQCAFPTSTLHVAGDVAVKGLLETGE